MVSDMYIFDLQTFIWTKVEPKPDDPVPGPRYFHSADACESSLQSIPLASQGISISTTRRDALDVTPPDVFHST